MLHICSFDSGIEITKKTKYIDFKNQIVAVGRFSIWEASDHPNLYTKLCNDPELEVEIGQFPWTHVKLKHHETNK